jgi:hypothetical protein
LGILYDLKDQESIKKGNDVKKLISTAAKRILQVGFLFFILGVKIDKRVMITNTFIINLGFYAPLIFKKFKRYGPDTTAYINQAGQFALG